MQSNNWIVLIRVKWMGFEWTFLQHRSCFKSCTLQSLKPKNGMRETRRSKIFYRFGFYRKNWTRKRCQKSRTHADPNRLFLLSKFGGRNELWWLILWDTDWHLLQLAGTYIDSCLNSLADKVKLVHWSYLIWSTRLACWSAKSRTKRQLHSKSIKKIDFWVKIRPKSDLLGQKVW